MFYIEDKNFVSKEQKEALNGILTGGNCPFYLTLEASVPNDGGINFVHHVIHRDSPEKVNSILHPLFVSILDNFCKNNNLEYSKIHRCAINITINNGNIPKCPTHTDHIFPHNQLLIYLNNSEGDTVILDKNNIVLKISEPELYKGIAFESTPHYHYFPIKGIRIVAIITFS